MRKLRRLTSRKVDPTGNTGYMDTGRPWCTPKSLHDSHNCLPLAAGHLEITKDMLFDATIELGEKLGQKFRPHRENSSPTLSMTKKNIYVTL